MKRRLIVVLLALAMSLTFITGCTQTEGESTSGSPGASPGVEGSTGSGASPGSDTGSGTDAQTSPGGANVGESVPNASPGGEKTSIEGPFDVDWKGPLQDGLPRFRICVNAMSFTDLLGSQFKAGLEYLQEAFNVEFVFVEAAASWTDEAIAMFESVMESGIDGMIMLSASPAVLDLAKRYGNIPIVNLGSEPADDNAAREAAAFDNFLGSVCGNDYESGVLAAETLYNNGARKFGVIGIVSGLSKAHDQRAKGFVDFINSKSDAVLLAEDYSLLQFDAAVSNFAAAFPDMDGILVTASAEPSQAALVREGLAGKIHYGAVDITDSTGEFLENGWMDWVCGGGYAQAMICFAVVYNYLIDGTRIIPDPAVTFYYPFLPMKSYDDYMIFEDLVAFNNKPGEVPVFTVGEMGNMIHYFNEIADMSFFSKLAADFTIANVKQRRS